jgi:peptide/nickel transport system permease protein
MSALLDGTAPTIEPDDRRSKTFLAAASTVWRVLTSPIVTLIVKRIASAILIVFVLASVVFVLARISPLDPVHAMLGPNASAQAVAAQRAALGLDDPPLTQYVHYMQALLHGDLGTSYRTRRPVSEDLATFFPATAELALYAVVFAVVLGVLFAVSTSLRWPGARPLRGLLMATASAPAFLLSIGAILVFYKQLGWLPASGRTSIDTVPTGPTGLLTIDGLLHGQPDVTWDAFLHVLLPALAVSFGPAVAIGRVLRTSLGAEERSDYARTARAKGMTEGAVLRRHVLRNAVGPGLSMTGLQVGLMFAGVLVVEQIFGWPGIGQYTAQSIPVADFPAIAGVTLMLGVGYIVINTVVDILQGLADPRINA